MIRETKKYYFSVEGETEQLYLEWLEKAINACSDGGWRVSFNVKVQKDPLSFVKGLTIQSEAKIFHFCDYESSEEQHQRQFERSMDRMVEAEDLGKQVEYQFGYSNFTFDLWIVLHKADCYGCINDRHQYLDKINSAFSEDFENMDKYKKKDNFKRCLSKLTLDDVRNAVLRSEKIMSHNAKFNSFVKYKKFKYYRENPALEVGTIIGGILKDCGLMS